MPESARVWLIIPTYNERSNVERIVTAALEQLPANRRVLIVDDDSPDGTGEIADSLADAHADVAVLHRPRKEGIGPAYVAGFRQALAGGRSWLPRWMPTSRTTRPICRGCSKPRAMRTSCSGRDTWTAAASPTGARGDGRSVAAEAPMRGLRSEWGSGT